MPTMTRTPSTYTGPAVNPFRTANTTLAALSAASVTVLSALLIARGR